MIAQIHLIHDDGKRDVISQFEYTGENNLELSEWLFNTRQENKGKNLWLVQEDSPDFIYVKQREIFT